ncbi:hypothetical protein G4B88_025007 [Cannabis sativa]|uniref:Plastocyanin-like domain-containing protein n=1 Tax=Cannabis sativa TaxID=3483 RepID=A0A7J6EHC2_CANSA|nr:hypothetical protein G4B88_025007 [Cannabis sativa]
MVNKSLRARTNNGTNDDTLLDSAISSFAVAVVGGRTQSTFLGHRLQGAVVMGINGQFPGPTIRANAGDTVVVLTNKLHTEGVVIHWHGIRQLGTPWADGTASIPSVL